MAQVQIQAIIDHLDHDIRRALEATIKEHYPDETIDARGIFRTFKRMIGRKCNLWEKVPDHLVDVK